GDRVLCGRVLLDDEPVHALPRIIQHQLERVLQSLLLSQRADAQVTGQLRQQQLESRHHAGRRGNAATLVVRVQQPARARGEGGELLETTPEDHGNRLRHGRSGAPVRRAPITQYRSAGPAFLRPPPAVGGATGTRRPRCRTRRGPGWTAAGFRRPSTAARGRSPGSPRAACRAAPGSRAGTRTPGSSTRPRTRPSRAPAPTPGSGTRGRSAPPRRPP